jgi:probable HAF family extracellular repeat protein
MIDVGTLGGVCGYATDLNNLGQVIGNSDLAGDLTFHPFSWTKSGGMKDLGTFGGDNGQANSLNDAGEVVGKADFPGNQLHDAFLWQNGTMTDLGNLGKTSDAVNINSSGQIVGGSRINDAGDIRAFLWENGGPMVDLNTVVPPHPGGLAHLYVLCKGGDSCCWRRDFHPGLAPLVDSHRALFPESITPIAAPRPLLRFQHQPSRYRIPVHVAQLLDPLARRPHVEIIEATLPHVLAAEGE